MKKYLFTFALLFVFAVISNSIIFCQASRTIKETADLPVDGTLLIDTYKGSIIITTWDKPQVEINAKIEAEDWGDDDQEMVDATEIKIREKGNGLSITTDYHKVHNRHSWFFGWFGDNGGNMPFVHYRITMPSTASLKIKDYKSETNISDLNSELNLETYKGTVLVKGLSGSIDFETYKGEAKLYFTKLSSDCKLETYKGKIDIYLPSENGFKIDADLGRRVSFESDFDVPVKRHSKHDNNILEKINGGGPVLNISSEKGDIRILKQ